MAEVLTVDPDRLQVAARAQADVGTFVSQMGTGQSLTNAATGMAGLLSEAACRAAGSILDAAANTLYDELAMHSANLATAAGHYRDTDEEFGRRFDQQMK